MDFADRWWSVKKTPYVMQRTQSIMETSAILKPYGGDGHAADSPVDMKRARLLKCSAIPFKKTHDIREILLGVVEDLAPYLRERYAIATGDYYCYRNLVRLIREFPSLLAHLLPLPGPFHVLLNAQQALYRYFGPLIRKLWSIAFPDKKLPHVMRPLRRKYFLDLLSRAWKDARAECIHLWVKYPLQPAEISALFLFFDEYLPLSLDLYSVFLAGDYDAYESMLYRALFLFAQVGKAHYVHCILLFIATVDHWRSTKPEFFEQFRRNYRYTSEEEVEIFHSILRRSTSQYRELDSFVRFVNFVGSTRESVEQWMKRTGVRSRRGGRPKDHTPEKAKELSVVIIGMFSRLIAGQRKTLPDGPGHWRSAELGQFDDRMLPLPLQRNRNMYGLRTIRLGAYKVEHSGILGFCSRTLCGHCIYDQTEACKQCAAMIRHIAVCAMRAVCRLTI
jgi:hypothetical protein